MSSSDICRIEKPFEYAEHTADVMIVAYGCSLEEAFSNAAYGFANFIYDVSKVELKKRVEVEVEGIDLEQLLFNWIDELLYRLDAENFALGKIEKLEIVKENDKYKLRAVLLGEDYDKNKHGFKGTIIKAMTYHMMEIRKTDSVWRLQYVVDI